MKDHIQIKINNKSIINFIVFCILLSAMFIVGIIIKDYGYDKGYSDGADIKSDSITKQVIGNCNQFGEFKFYYAEYEYIKLTCGKKTLNVKKLIDSEKKENTN